MARLAAAWYALSKRRRARMTARTKTLRPAPAPPDEPGFQTTLLELACEVMNLPESEIDAGVRHILMAAAEFCGADRCGVYEYFPRRKALREVDSWVREGCVRLTENVGEIALGELEDTFGIELAPAAIDDLLNDERVPEPARELFSGIGIHALLWLPVHFSEESVMAVGIAAPHETAWSDMDPSVLRLTGQLIVNATLRKRADGEIRSLANRFQRFADSVEQNLFIWNPNPPALVYSNASLGEMIGFKADDLGNDPSWVLERVLPEYREAFVSVFSEATVGPKELEYRIRHVDGSLRWLRTRAFPYHEGDDDSAVMVAGITEDITERMTVAESGVRLREFEGLLQQITNSFVGAPAGQLSDRIDTALARLGAFADVERVGIYESDPDLTTVSGTHEWCAPGIESKIRNGLQNYPLADLPFLTGQLREGRTLATESLDELPDLSDAERRLLDNLGVRSRIQVPLVSGDTILGVMILVTTTRTRRWSVEETAMLRVAGDVVSGAIAKERTERVQDRRLQLEQLFAQLANEFMNLPPGELAAGLGQALDSVAKSIGGNRAGIYLLTDSGEDAELAYSWWTPGTEPIPDEFHRLPAGKGSPYGDWLISGEPFLIATPASFEAEDGARAEGLRRRGVGAVVSAALKIDGKPVGWIALANWAPRNTWTEDELSIVAIAAGVFSNMVARKRAEAERARYHQMERVLSEFATTLINGPIDAIDDSLTGILSQLGSFSGAERGGIFQFDTTRTALSMSHGWVNDGSAPPSVLTEKFSVAQSEWNFLKPDETREDWQGLATDLSPEDAPTKAALDFIGSKSFCTAKIATADHFYGILALSSPAADFLWSQETRLLLRAAAGIAASVLEKRDHQEESTQHQHALAHALRVGSMGQLATGLAHELNQPLTAISNYTTACNRRLHDGNIDNDELTDILQRVTGQALRAGDIIRKLRAHVSKGGAPRKLEHINKLIERSLSLLAVEARESRVDLRFAPTEDLPRVSVDATEIEQVIINLVRNGIESIRDANAAVREIRIETSLRGKNLQVTIADSGPGFSEADAEELFNQFHTTKEEGMGLGLAISRFLVRAHGGSIEASASPGGGAVFQFWLPAAIVQT